MDDLDRFLKLELARMLDPIVAVLPPRRRGQRPRPQLRIMIDPDQESSTLAGPGGLKIDAVPLVVEPVAPLATGSAAYS